MYELFYENLYQIGWVVTQEYTVVILHTICVGTL